MSIIFPGEASLPKWQRDVPSAQPGPLIISLLHLDRELGGTGLGSRSVMTLMAELGAQPPSTRAALKRLRQRGVIVQECEAGAGVPRFLLHPSACEEIDVINAIDAAAQVSARTAQDPALKQWTLVVFSIPEVMREMRYDLRALLTRLGFGIVSSGAWIGAGAGLPRQLELRLERAKLRDFVTIFEVAPPPPPQIKERIGKWWNFDSLNQNFIAFCQRWQQASESLSHHTLSPQQSFSTYITVISEWRQLAALAPQLSDELLPEDWAGRTARACFGHIIAQTSAMAHDHFRHARSGTA